MGTVKEAADLVVALRGAVMAQKADDKPKEDEAEEPRVQEA